MIHTPYAIRHTPYEICARAAAGERLTRDEGIVLFRSADLLSLGMASDAIRWRKHPEPIVTYVIDRNINYTNVCASGCRFCAFYTEKDSPNAYVLSKEEIGRKIEEMVELGGTQILMQGGLHPDLGLDFYEKLFRWIKEAFEIHIHGLSPPEIVHIARISRATVQDVLQRLRKAGLDSIPGGGAEILADRVRREISPGKCTADEWLDVMETAHRIGMRTTATMMFGHVERVEDRVEHLLRIRELQDRTGGFTAFIPWTFQPMNTELGGVPAGGVAYLKTLAISRLMLDNVDNIQASWVTQGSKVAQVALKFGANDLGGTMIEENVVRAAGAAYRLSLARLRRIIVDAGYAPRQRNMQYELLE